MQYSSRPRYLVYGAFLNISGYLLELLHKRRLRRSVAWHGRRSPVARLGEALLDRDFDLRGDDSVVVAASERAMWSFSYLPKI